MTPTQIAAARELAEMRRARNLLARDSISAAQLLDELGQLKEKLIDCDPVDIPRLMAIANINFNLLKKVLPDLKPVEQERGEKEATVIHIDRTEYAEVRRAMLEKADV